MVVVLVVAVLDLGVCDVPMRTFGDPLRSDQQRPTATLNSITAHRTGRTR